MYNNNFKILNYLLGDNMDYFWKLFIINFETINYCCIKIIITI